MANPFRDEGGQATSNPFRDDDQDAGGAYGGGAYGGSSGAYGGNDSLQARLSELDRREAELNRREQQLEYRERKVGEVQEKLKDTLDRSPNWPKCRPVLYHSIKDEIPEGGQRLVKRVYFAWYLSAGMMILNVAGCLSRLIALQANGGTDFGIAIAEMVIGPIIFFVFWYRPLYKAVRRDKTTMFFVFLFCYAWHIVYSTVMAIGIPNTGSSGFINAFETVNVNVGAFIVMLIAASAWVLVTLYHVWQFKGVIQYYRSKGLHEKAKQEMSAAATSAAVSAAQSDAGRQFAADAAGAYVSQQHV